MGRFTISLVLVAALFVAGVAWAQQELIVEPWRKAPSPPAAHVLPLRAMPASGLDSVPRPTVPPRREAPELKTPPHKWSPPVVELLVDPWGEVPPPGADVGRRWALGHVEVVDPWERGPSAPPRTVAPASSVPTPASPRVTIF